MMHKANLIRFFGMWIVITLSTACTHYLPDSFTNVGIFSYDFGEEIPSESQRASTFEVSFDDMWRAIEVSVAQSQWVVDAEDKELGAVVAKKVSKETPFFATGMGCIGNMRPHKRVDWFAIVLSESGPKSTTVTVFSKIQGGCVWCGAGVELSKCKEYSTLHWATEKEGVDQNLNQFFLFLKNNLISWGFI